MPDTPYGSDDGPLGHDRHAGGGTNGFRASGMHTRSVPFDDIEDPIDLVAVQADDELINALSAGMSVSSPGMGGYSADDRVAAILAAWKAEVDERPIPELVDVDTAVSTVLAARRPPSRRARHLVPVAAAAAFVVLAIGGVSVGSYNARPDDALWGVSKVLYSERAESVEAAARVEDRIASAKEALVAGEPVRAAAELAQAETDLGTVRPEEGRGELAETQDFLRAKAAETPPGQSSDPGAPLSAQPSRPVPPGATVEPDRDRDRDQQRDRDRDTTSRDSTLSSTPSPDRPSESGGPDSSSRDTSSSDPGEDMRLRQAPAAPDPDSSDPATRPSRPGQGGGGNDGGNGGGDGRGEGGPDDPTRDTPTREEPPPATPEGQPDPTTTPTAGDGSGGGDSGGAGATVSGEAPQPTPN